MEDGVGPNRRWRGGPADTQQGEWWGFAAVRAELTMKIVLVRLAQTEQATMGHLETAEHELLCCTLELPWRDNHHDTSCVPAGTYQCKRDLHKGKYEVWELQDVPNNRTDVQVHVANKASQVLGCIAVGESFGRMDGEPAVRDSQPAFDRLMKRTKDAITLELEIKESWCEDATGVAA